MTSLIFEHSPALPCVFSSVTSTFTACLSCGTACEVRYCDGTTKPVWTLCLKHQELNDSGQIRYDKELYLFLRESVYKESIPKPQPRSQQCISTPCHTPSPAPSPKSNLSESAFATLDPEQDLILKSRRTDQPASDVSTIHKQRSFRHGAIHVLWPVPTTTYSHSHVCVHNPTVLFTTSCTDLFPATIKLLTTPSSLAKQDAYYEKVVNESRNQANERWVNGDNSLELEQRICEVEEETRAGRLAKGIFFRRCNGLYMNVLGWVWRDEFEINEEELHEMQGNGKAAVGAVTEITSGCIVHSEHHSNEELQREDMNGGNGEIVNHVNHQNYSINSKESGKPPIRHLRFPSKHAQTTTHPQNGHHLPALDKQALSSNTPSPPTSQSSTISQQPSASSRTTLDPVTSTSIETGISATRLLTRERLVQSRKLLEEDLIITYWVWNQQNRTIPSSKVNVSLER